MSEQNFLYRFFNATGQLLYVGITMNPPQRFKAHQSEKDWWTEVSGITVESYASRSELAAAERRAIHVERPAYNVIYNQQKPLVPAMPSGLRYVCQVCGGSVTGKSGYIHVSRSEALAHSTAWSEYKRRKREAGEVIWNADELMDLPERARWMVHHRKCDPFPDDGQDYWFEVERADSHQKLLSWTAHLLDKEWIRDTNWSEFLYARISKEAQAC